MEDAPSPLARARLALALLAVDPSGLGGIVVRARAGPVREALLEGLAALPGPLVRVPPYATDARLFGGVDVAATLASERVVHEAGALAGAGALLLPMAERIGPALAARLALAMDAAPRPAVALDEGDADEAAPPALAERMAFRVDLDGIALGEVTEDPLSPQRPGHAGIRWQPFAPGAGRSPTRRAGEKPPLARDAPSVREPLAEAAIGRNPALPPGGADGRSGSSDAHPALGAARGHLASVAVPPDLPLMIASAAMRLGIDSLRAPVFALRAARAHAALRGADAVEEPDLLAAIDLTLAHRATRIPEAESAPPDPETGETPPEDGDRNSEQVALPDEILLDAVRANLPPGLLDGLAAQTRRRGHGAGSGARRRSNRRGRPLPARPGRLDGAARIDVVATLRTAAPWQRIRAGEDGARRIRVRPSDIHIKRFEQKSDRLLIFAVDASGSAALARLAEAKGAVELLLAQAYARRDHVALVAFRGEGAEVLLPPTRSLVRTKRQLARLPGGGGTPLAAGLMVAMELARTASGRGLTPTLVLLTDGRANIALDGTPDRTRAASDAQEVARALRLGGCDAIVLDTGNRSEPGLAALAATLGGLYLPLPRADAHRLSGAVAAAIGG